MKAKQTKQTVLAELELITDLAIGDVKNAMPEDVFGYYMDEINQAKGIKQAGKKSHLVNLNHSLSDQMYSIEIENGKIEFPIGYVPLILYGVKKEWPEKIKTMNGSGKGMNRRGKSMQSKVMELREDWQDIEKRNSILNQYKRAGKNDIIRLCWKFITDPRELEGIHFAWVNPVVKYEQYKEMAA